MIAKILGAGSRDITASSRLTLDAGSSFDSDQGPASGTGLLYTWTCQQRRPLVNSACSGLSLSTGQGDSEDAQVGRVYPNPNPNHNPNPNPNLILTLTSDVWWKHPDARGCR